MTLNSIKGAFDLPRPPVGIAGIATLGSTSTLTASGFKNAKIIQAPKAGNVRKIGFRAGAVSGTEPTVDVRLESLDRSTGLPTGTLVGTNTNGSQLVASNIYYTTTLTADAAVTQGQLLAIVIAFLSGSGSPSIVIQDFSDEGGNGTRDFPYVANNPNTSWTKTASSPLMHLEYDDGSVEAIPGAWPISAVTSVTITSATDPDCVGVQCNLPFDYKIIGVWVWLDCTAANANFNVKLYDSDGHTDIAAYAHSGAIHGGTIAGIFYLTLDRTPTLLGNTNYMLAIEGSSTGNVIVQTYDVPSGLIDVLSGGGNFIYVSAKDPSSDSSWTRLSTRRAAIGLRVQGIGDAITVVLPGMNIPIMD
jgi:hypothetical protein